MLEPLLRERPAGGTRARVLVNGLGAITFTQARDLVDMFRANLAKFEMHVDADVLAAAPILQQAAE